jgi:hypothetical protein
LHKWIHGFITSAIKHHNPDVGARRAVPRLGEARLAPTIDMFNCPRNIIFREIDSEETHWQYYLRYLVTKSDLSEEESAMGNTFVEVVFEGHYNTVRGYIEGLQDGIGSDYKFFFSSETDIAAETLSELIKEWVSLGHRLHHVVMEEVFFAILKDVLSKKGSDSLMTSSSIKSSKNIKEATFDFKFDAYARKYAEEIKELLGKLPEGVSLHHYKPEEKINHDAEGVELYAPAHDYIFHGKGTIIGPIEQVVAFHMILDDHPLIEAEKIFLELEV